MIIPNLVETHCHILPGIDDGAQTTDESIKLIKMLKTQGCEKIVCTPHYYSDNISLNDFLLKRDNAVRQLKSALTEDMPQILPAAEVFITDYLLNNDDLSPLCIGNSPYILIEHPFSCDFSAKILNRLENMCINFNVKPILAHIERYEALMENKDVVDELIDMGCLIQVNIDSFEYAHRKTKKRLFKYLESGRIHLIGSDCHNLTTRVPNYEPGITAIKEKLGSEAIDILIKNANILTK